jgi:hypothetical protein
VRADPKRSESAWAAGLPFGPGKLGTQVSPGPLYTQDLQNRVYLSPRYSIRGSRVYLGLGHTRVLGLLRPARPQLQPTVNSSRSVIRCHKFIQLLQHGEDQEVCAGTYSPSSWFVSGGAARHLPLPTSDGPACLVPASGCPPGHTWAANLFVQDYDQMIKKWMADITVSRTHRALMTRVHALTWRLT